MKNRVMLLMCVMLLISSIPAAAIAQPNPIEPVTPAGPEAVLNWNAIAQRTTIQVARQFPQQAVVYISYLQAAVYNAVVAIEGRYEPYKINLAQRPGASIDAAVSTAAWSSSPARRSR